MPSIGLGVFQIAEPQECERSVTDALDVDYRLIDTAAAYISEEAVGNGPRRSGVPRQDLFVTSKPWVQDTGFEATQRAIDKSLSRLQLDYLDLYLIHQPCGDVYGSWRAMEQAHAQGKLRVIGVSAFEPGRLMDSKALNKVPPAVNQIEINPWFQQADSVKFMRDNGTQAEAWVPFAEGRKGLFENAPPATIGAKHRRSVDQVVLRWLLQRGVVWLARTVRKGRMAENFGIFDFQLQDAEIKEIESLDIGRNSFVNHSNPAVVKRMSESRLGI